MPPLNFDFATLYCNFILQKNLMDLLPLFIRIFTLTYVYSYSNGCENEETILPEVFSTPRCIDDFFLK